MKLQINVPKVHCFKKNDWFLNKDQIFVAIIVTTGKIADFTAEGKPKIAFAGVSPLLKIGKKEIKEMPLGSKWEADLGDAEGYAITIGLYEKDKGDLYDEMLKKVTEITRIDSKIDVLDDLKQLAKDSIDSFDLVKLLEGLAAIGIKVIKELRKDDSLGIKSLEYAINDEAINFVPEFDFNESGSKYKMQVAFKKVTE